MNILKIYQTEFVINVALVKPESTLIIAHIGISLKMINEYAINVIAKIIIQSKFFIHY